MPVLLQALIRTHKENFGRSKHGKRYKEELVRNFSLYSRDLAGKQCYEFWSKNLPMLSTSGVAHLSKKESLPVTEGEFRWKELGEYCDKLGVEREVIVAEDGTRIKGKPELDPTTNQIIGFVPALDKNGLPKINSFDATEVKDIERMFATETVSNYAYVIMAQPLADVAPFCLAIFGSNNKFTAMDVEKRWEWMLKESSRHEITIRGFASDADTRLLSTMRHWTFSKSDNVLPELENIFFSSMDAIDTGNQHEPTKPLCFQDTIHSVAKLKSQLMKDRTGDNVLVMGQEVASGNFLHCLINEESKFDHGLTKSDLIDDRMNFRAVQKASEDRVLQLLEAFPGAKATKAYLIVLRGVMDSFLEKTIDSCERVYLIWRSVFYLRFWKIWLKENNYKASHFITSYTYNCIEITAHSLVNMIRRLRDENKAHMLLTWLFSSQPCEEFFRDGRSFTSAFSTVVNMSMKEFLQRARKLERFRSVGHKLAKDLEMPRHHKKMQESSKRDAILREQGLGTDQELIEAILRARLDALAMASEVGMRWDEIPEVSLDRLGLLPKAQAMNVREEDSESNNDEDDNLSEEMLDDDLEQADNDPENERMPVEVADDILFAEQVEEGIPEIPANSPYVIYEEKGKRMLLKRSTLIWGLITKKFGLSSDRKVRVKEAEDTLREAARISLSEVTIAEEVHLGDWCVFKNSPIANHFYVGKIIGFSYLSGKGNSKAYSLQSAPVVTPHDVEPRGIGCMGLWYTVAYEGDGSLNRHVEEFQFHDIKRYKCTLPTPCSRIGYSEEVLKAVAKVMKWRPKTKPTTSTQPSHSRRTRSSVSLSTKQT